MTIRSLISALIVAIAGQAMAADSPPKDFDVVMRADYYGLQRDAAAAYEKKNYDDALKKIQRLACAGDKTSQATLGTMYLDGKGVQRNDLTAYEWFKVAAEYNFAPYRKISKVFEEQMSPAQAQFTGPRVTELLSRYGMRATNVSCEVGSSTWSASNMKNNLQCTPESVNGGTQFLLHRCVDEKDGEK